MIVSTSLIGSYIIVRTISLVFGGFPNELNFNTNISTNTLTTLPWTFYIYFGVFIVLFIIGIYFQYIRQHIRLNSMVLNEELLGIIESTEGKLQ